jgi:lipid A 4'-phosphatase
LTSTRLLSASLAALVMTALVFLVFPGLDLTVASLFALGNDRFLAQTPLGNALRHLFYYLPIVIFALALGLYGVRRFGRSRLWSPTGAGMLFMALSLALGPLLIVNVVLKDHSHRPRPYQVTEFGGDEAFRPFYRFDGACRRNCSFVSGESSSAFWTLAPALLVPLPYRPVAVAAALVFGAATSLLRMAFGGHFLSDTLFAGLFTWLAILGSWRLVTRFCGVTPSGD